MATRIVLSFLKASKTSPNFSETQIEIESLSQSPVQGRGLSVGVWLSAGLFLPQTN